MNNLFSTLTSASNIVAIPILLLVVVFLICFQLRKERSYTNEDKFDQLYLKIKEEIKFAVAPKFMQLSLEVTHLVELANEIWRIEQRVIKSSLVLGENQKKGLEVSIQKLKKYIERYDIEFVDYTNQKYNDGLNLDILSVEKDPTVDIPFVKETVEPTILCKGQVVKRAKIILTSH